MKACPIGIRPLVAVLAIACGATTSHAEPLAWTTIVNNGVTVPGTTAKFNSYNQPAVNNRGLVVFRARGKVPTTGGETTAGTAAAGSGETVVSGVFLRDMGVAGPVAALAVGGSPVPSPNNTMYNGALSGFNEFPSSPRIDVTSNLVATRGQSQPVYTYLAADGVTETRVGTSGVYASTGAGLVTAASLLGAVLEVQPDTSYSLTFPYFSVPDAIPGTRFDQFPGSPAVSDGTRVSFKGNWTDPVDGLGKTGVYFRDIAANGGKAPVTLVASANTLIPNQAPGGTVKFGATAAPSAANGFIAFTGWDNEEAPTIGGVYRAAAIAGAPLQTLVAIGDVVPGESPGATFRNFGEGLSMSEDGRYVAFWGTWGTETTPKLLLCPTDGNADLLAYCNTTYPSGYVANVPVHQGIFVADAQTGIVTAIAKTGADGITTMQFWGYSGAPPGVGGGTEGAVDASREPPRWRSSAFAALDSHAGGLYGSRTEPSPFQAAFKATRNGVDGIYLRRGGMGTPLSTVVETLLSTGQSIDAAAPANSIVTAVGIERDAFRREKLVVAVSMLYETVDTSIGWAGLYLATVPALGAAVTPTIVLTSSASPSVFGQTVTFTVLVSGSAGTPGGSVDFLDGGVAIPGCSAVALSAGQATCTTSDLSTGSHTIKAAYSGDSGYFAGQSNQLAHGVGAPPSLVGLSTRAQVLTGDDVLIGGFTIDGPGNKTVVVRGIGPSLAAAGVAAPLANPMLVLVRASNREVIATNDDWGSAGNAADLVASGFAPSNPLEAALLVTLEPGAYTAIVSGVNGGTGVGLFETFQVDHPEIPFASVSARSRITAGDGVLIAGFIVPQGTSQRVMVRARGPSLVPYGLNIADLLRNPKLQLMHNGAVVETSDDWQSSPSEASIRASGFAPSDAFESAILRTLPGGAYTAVVTGADGGAGVAIVEVFRMP